MKTKRTIIPTRDYTAKVSGKLLVEFFIPGQPVPSERVRRGKGNRFYMPKRSADYRKHIIEHLPDALLKAAPVKTPVCLIAFFDREGNRKCDIDNLVKAIQDALLGVVYTDDSQVTILLGSKSTVDEGDGGVRVAILLDADMRAEAGR